MGGRTQTVVGVIGVGVIGVIAIAAIYQFGKAPTLTNDIAGPSGLGQATLGALFK
jgi:hypothetical protein